MDTVVTLIGRWQCRFENLVTALLLAVIILLSFSQIVLRLCFSSGVIWIDETVRLLVLWLCMFGALLASRGNKHITIDLVARGLPFRQKQGLLALTCALTTAVSGVVAWHAVGFLQLEREFGTTVLGDIPSWYVQMVIPYAFGIIAIRYALHALCALRSMVRGKERCR